MNQWLERSVAAEDAGEIPPTGPRPRVLSPTTKAFIRYMNHDGGREFLAKNGTAALVRKYRESGGTIGPEYAKKIVLEFFRAEHEKGKTANPCERASYKRGSGPAFFRFIDTQGGLEILATRGFDTILEDFKAAGGDIVRGYAKKLVMPFL